MDADRPDEEFRRVVVGPHERDAFHRFHLASDALWIIPLEDDDFDALVRGGHVFGLLRGQEPVAMAYLHPASTHARGAAWELGGVAVDPTVRGRGLAADVCGFAITTVLADDPAPVTALVQEGNSASMRVMLRLGFVDTGRRAEAGPDRFAGHLQRDDRGFAVALVLELSVDGVGALVGTSADDRS